MAALHTGAGTDCSTSLFFGPSDGNFKGKTHEFDGRVYIRSLMQIHANPATLRKDVVRSGAAGGDQLVAHVLREGDVYQAVAVYVADFPSPQAEFRAAKAMRLGSNSGKALQGGLDLFFCSRNGHPTFPPRVGCSVWGAVTITGSLTACTGCSSSFS